MVVADIKAMKAGREESKATVSAGGREATKAWLKRMEVNQEKLKIKMEAYP
jgi:hypothetical protein